MVEILAILNFGGFMERSEFFLGGGGFVKNQYMGVELPKRGELGQFADLRGELDRKEWGGGGVLSGD